MKTKLHYVLSIAMLLFVFSSFAQNSTWKKINSPRDSKNLSNLQLNSNKVHLFELDMPSLKKNVSTAPLRGVSKKTSSKIISIPALGGQLENFKLYEAPVLSSGLAAKYPNIKSYVGISLDDPKTRLRMSVSPQGVQTMISYVGKSTVFMQPIRKGSNEYVLYERKDKNKLKDPFQCKTIDAISKNFNNLDSKSSKVNEGGANNKTLQKFRIAVSTTAEYTAFHDDSNAVNGDAVADAVAAINATLSRVNQVFEADMAIRFELVDATQLIYTDAATDPYSDANVGADEDNFNNTNGWSFQVQNNLTSVIGNSAYDIGHLFGASGGGGFAGCRGCVCVDDTVSTTDKNKGSAFTSPSNGSPQGDTFDIDYVAHEIGHQMGANHTWAFETEGTGVNSEPGSGTTIMAYAGLQGADNVALNSDDYFHYHSIKQILDNLSTKSCQTTEAITNDPPIADAGNDYNIPKGTAYVLKGSATDTDSGDNLTYCWEQIDSGATTFLNFGPTLTSGSMNRSLPPSSDSDRYIPKFASVLAGNTTQTDPTLGSDWETVSTVARTLNWALTVRDRAPIAASGGQTSYDRMQINVEDVTPFTLKNTVSWAQGSTQNIEWVVGQTTNATINCQNVSIKLSTDGGLTFPTTIANNVPNNGSFPYTVPVIANTTNARLLIEASDNIFYDVSDYNFSISTDPDFFIVEEVLTPINCGETTVVYHFDFVVANGFADNTTFSASGIPGSGTATFSPTNLSTSGNVTMTISDLDGIAQNNYTIIITGTALTKTKDKNIDFSFFNSLCTSVATTEFETSTTLVQFNTINQSSAKPSGYTNYISTPTVVDRGSFYDLTVNANTDGNFITNTKVWIDWNQNCEFDVEEEYDLGDAFNVADGETANSPLSITIPNDAVSGTAIMRVSTKYKDDGLPSACENGFDGEVEDYAINISTNTEYNASINLVEFNSINNATGKSSYYVDYSSISTELNRDSNYDLNINVTTDGNFTTATKVWIDWNQNSIFNDIGEEYDLGDVTNGTNEATSNSPLSINIPIDAVLGNTIMRVVTGYTGAQELSPSTNGFNGEVEDYTLNILPTESIEQFGFENFIVYPNPNNGEFTLKLNGSLMRDITVGIFDSRGRLIYSKTIDGSGDFEENIKLGYVKSGLYILNVSDGLKKAMKKIIIN